MEMYRIAVEAVDGGINVFLKPMPFNYEGPAPYPKIIVPEGMQVKTLRIGMIELVPARKPCPIQWEYVPERYEYAVMDRDGSWFVCSEAPYLIGGAWDVPSSGQSAILPLKTTDIPFQDSLYCRYEV